VRRRAGGIARLRDDRRVYFNGTPPRYGTMAERAPVDPAASFTVPDGLDAGLAVACGIYWASTMRASVKRRFGRAINIQRVMIRTAQ
jgi:NADPH:quinone reductase-like Zn-dependent oxidoreductase